MGTSARSACDLPYVQDHPHACGDKYFCQVRHRHVVGSSPRVWGQVSASSSFNKYKGIIPTRVGTSGIVDMSHITHQDHPHACGDKYFCQVRHRHVVGSSPRVWGQVSASSSFNKYKGIIPTRVGTSGIVDMSHITHQDHPHACGDKTDDKTSTRTDNGSSPRVWGQERCSARIPPTAGIIPTRVGTRKQIFQICTMNTGSSPRVWGQDINGNRPEIFIGIIPTRVGTSLGAPTG